MNYFASISDFFKSPRWLNNLLLAGVCVLIPIAGQIVVMGWLVTVFWTRDDENYSTYPAFDFGQFEKYLLRGLWPFLVILVAVCGMMLATMLVTMLLLVIIGVIASQEPDGLGGLTSIAFMIMFLVDFALIIGMAVVLAPLHIRASITQNFASSFNFGFAKRFIGLMWKEIIVAWLFSVFATMVFMSLGALVFCIGMYFAMVPIYFSSEHLKKQLYLLYLKRGGEPVPRSPKLTELPPSANLVNG